MNPLQKLIGVAYINELYAQGHSDYRRTKPYLNHTLSDLEYMPFEQYGEKSIYNTKELAGVAGLYYILQKQGYQIVYANDLGLSIVGIDCIAVKNSTWYIGEAKGTTSKRTALSSFLKNTKTKGRQMSWDWIWRSLVNFAESPLNAGVFLSLYKDLILQTNAKRIVGVSQLAKAKHGYIISNTQMYEEAHIASLKRMNNFTNVKNLQQWLKIVNSKEIQLYALEQLQDTVS